MWWKRRETFLLNPYRSDQTKASMLAPIANSVSSVHAHYEDTCPDIPFYSPNQADDKRSLIQRLDKASYRTWLFPIQSTPNAHTSDLLENLL